MEPVFGNTVAGSGVGPVVEMAVTVPSAATEKYITCSTALPSAAIDETTTECDPAGVSAGNKNCPENAPMLDAMPLPRETGVEYSIASTAAPGCRPVSETSTGRLPERMLLPTPKPGTTGPLGATVVEVELVDDVELVDVELVEEVELVDDVELVDVELVDEVELEDVEEVDDDDEVDDELVGGGVACTSNAPTSTCKLAMRAKPVPR